MSPRVTGAALSDLMLCLRYDSLMPMGALEGRRFVGAGGGRA